MSIFPPIELINNVALLLGLALLYDLTLQYHGTRWLLPRLFYGVVIGGVGVAVMLTPWPVVPGIVFDTRSILLSLSGLFFGTVPTLIAIIITGSFRFYQGGAGMWVGVTVILVSGLLGLGWRHLRRDHRKTIAWVHFYLFGILVHVIMLLLMLMLPYPTSVLILSQITVPIMILYPVTTVLLGVVLQRQLDRELTGEKLREREERLQLALNAANMGTWDWQASTNEMTWDNVTFALTGVKAEEFGGTYQDFITMVLPADRKNIELALESASRTLQEQQVDFRIVRPDGEIRWMTVYGRLIGSRLSDERYVGIVKDITQERKSETALRLSRFAVDNAAEGMVVVRADGRLIDVNREECRRLGYSREEMLRLHVWDLDPALSADEWPAHWEKIKAAGQYQFTTTNITRDGSEIYLELSVAYIEFEDEEYYYAFSRDITQRRQIAAQLHQAQKMEAMGRLAGSIAHDFNNLLVPITGFAEMAMMQSDPNSKIWHYLTQIKKSADHVAVLTRQILAFSRNQILELTVIDINQIVVNFRGMIPRLVNHNIQVTFDLAEEPLLVEADASKMEQILLNFVVNAHDAMPNGGLLTISTGAGYLEEPLQAGFARLEPGDYVQFSVTDTGLGMSQETAQHIFEPFFTTKTADKGTGLGLATVHGIVQQHNGEVTVFSQPGEGASFRVALPRVKQLTPAAAPVELPPAPKPAPPRPATTTSPTILVAEDDPNVRLLLTETLKGLGYLVLEASDGEDAQRIFLAQTEPVQLLLSDYSMPDMNGVELYNRLKETSPELRVLFISGHAEESLDTLQIAKQGYSFLHKPFSMLALQTTVEKIFTNN